MTGMVFEFLAENVQALEIAANSRYFRNGIEALTNGDIVGAERQFGIPIAGARAHSFTQELTDNGLLAVATAFEEAWIAARRRGLGR